MICPYRTVYTVDKPRHVLVKLLPWYFHWYHQNFSKAYLQHGQVLKKKMRYYKKCCIMFDGQHPSPSWDTCPTLTKIMGTVHYSSSPWCVCVSQKNARTLPFNLLDLNHSKVLDGLNDFNTSMEFLTVFLPLEVTNLPMTGHHAALDSYGFASRGPNRINAGSLANSRDAIDTWLDPLHP